MVFSTASFFIDQISVASVLLAGRTSRSTFLPWEREMVNSAYSLIEHLGKTLWASRWREGCLAVYSAYFDASGQETDKYVAVSGFIVHANTWIDWERDWLECLVRREIVNKHGDPEFHMSDCANCEYFFEGWEETREQE